MCTLLQFQHRKFSQVLMPHPTLFQSQHSSQPIILITMHTIPRPQYHQHRCNYPTLTLHTMKFGFRRPYPHLKHTLMTHIKRLCRLSYFHTPSNSSHTFTPQHSLKTFSILSGTSHDPQVPAPWFRLQKFLRRWFPECLRCFRLRRCYLCRN